MRRTLLLSIILLASSHIAQAATVTLLTPIVLPGQTVIAAFDTKPTTLLLGGKPQTSFPYRDGWRMVAPIPLSATAGARNLRVNFAETKLVRSVIVLERNSPVIELPVPPKLNQTPTQLVQNLAITNTDINKTVQAVTETTRFKSPFGLPLTNNKKISSVFGEIRITRAMDSAGSPQVERINHLGTDFAQPKGSLVAAVNDGVVAKAYLDSTYGNSVFVDHGRGIFTLYLHLDSMRVKAGDVVKKGKIIGTLGETGLASAPHLHLSLKINGVSVDPLQFIASFR